MAMAEPDKALDSVDEIGLTVTGRASGRTISHPVWFIHEGDTMYLLPVKGSDSDWYKNVLKNPTIGIGAGGAAWTGKAIPITDRSKVHEIADRFRAKYGPGEVKKYYSKLDVAVKVPLGR
jgi:hypothetical protein